MRIDGLGRTIGAGGAVRGGGGASGFRVADGTESSATRSAAPLRSAPALDALMALQAVEPETARERRKREIKRGRGLLDALDGMKLALIEGRENAAALGSLAAQLRQAHGATAESGLDEVLSAIDLRAQVELAKRGA